ncbi:MAG: glycosyltransferase family 4 protein [Bacteroides sp.]|nr:glycosyltransferase family 4 protein [Bacteroides sp.]
MSIGDSSTLLYQLIHKIDAFVAPSIFMENHYKKYFSSLHAKSTCIYNSVPSPSTPLSSKNPSTPHLFAYGRLVKEKGFDIFLQAASRLKKVFPEWHFTIAGDGVERLKLEDQCRELGLDEKAMFTGWVAPSDIYEWIDTCSLVVVPSKWQEPFGITALQAMQRGRPVVASNAGGLSEVVVHGKTGVVVKPDNPELLADAIEHMVTDPEKLYKFGESALHRANSIFSWKTCVNEYENIYWQVKL